MQFSKVLSLLSIAPVALGSYFPTVYDNKLQLCANTTSDPYGTCGVLFADGKGLYRFVVDKTNFAGASSIFKLKDYSKDEHFGISVDSNDDLVYREDMIPEVITSANKTAIEVRISYEENESEILVYDLNNTLLWNKTIYPTIDDYYYHLVYVDDATSNNITISDVEIHNMEPEPETPLNSRNYKNPMPDNLIKCSRNNDPYSYDDCPNFVGNSQIYRTQINLVNLIAPSNFKQIFVMKEADKDHRWGLSFGPTKQLAENTDFTFTYYTSLGNSWTNKWYSVIFELEENADSKMSIYDGNTLVLNQTHADVLNTSETEYLYPVWYTNSSITYDFEMERMQRWITVPEYFNNQCANNKRKFKLSKEIKAELSDSCPTGNVKNLLSNIRDNNQNFQGVKCVFRSKDSTYTAQISGAGAGGWFKCFGFVTLAACEDYADSFGDDIPMTIINNFTNFDLYQDFSDCYTPPPVNGSWSDWSSWGSCDGTERSRSRTCDNPAPSNGGQECVGDNEETESCAHGGWSSWSAWGSCSGTPGSRTKPRTRTCTNPAPSNGGNDCVGDNSENQGCVICGQVVTHSGCNNYATYTYFGIIDTPNECMELCENSGLSGCCYHSDKDENDPNTGSGGCVLYTSATAVYPNGAWWEYASYCE